MRQINQKEANVGHDSYDHLRDSADADSPVDSPKGLWILVDQINGQSFGLFDSEKEAADAARTGADFVGGVPWGEEGWEVVQLQTFERDHADEGVEADYYTDIGNIELNRSAIIDEISNEIDNGDAHLLTRNELAEFVEWLVTDEGSAIDFGLDTLEINSVVHDFMEYGEFRPASKAFAVDVAKQFFVRKGYEK